MQKGIEEILKSQEDLAEVKAKVLEKSFWDKAHRACDIFVYSFFGHTKKERTRGYMAGARDARRETLAQVASMIFNNDMVSGVEKRSLKTSTYFFKELNALIKEVSRED